MYKYIYILIYLNIYYHNILFKTIHFRIGTKTLLLKFFIIIIKKLL